MTSCPLCFSCKLLFICECSVTQSCLTPCDPMDWSLPGTSIHGILQARMLECVAISFSRGSSQPRDQNCISCVSCIVRQIFYHSASWEVSWKLQFKCSLLHLVNVGTVDTAPSAVPLSPVRTTFKNSNRLSVPTRCEVLYMHYLTEYLQLPHDIYYCLLSPCGKWG